MYVKFKYPFKVVERTLKKIIGDDYKVLTNGEIAINSPFVSDTTYDCRINIDKQCFHDFESDEGGNIEELIAKLANITTEEARELLISNSLNKDDIDVFVPKSDEEIKLKKLALPSNCFSIDDKSNISDRNKVIKFLNDKMISYKLAKKYNIMWTSNNSFLKLKDGKIISFSKRVIIPSYESGDLVYFQGRDYTGKSLLRYKNPPKDLQHKKIILPFYDQIKQNSCIFLSEGPWEAIQYNGTYMIGPTISKEQILKIKSKNPKEIYIIPDNDDTGKLKLSRNISVIKNNLGCKVYIIKWWKGEYFNFKDPIDAKLSLDKLIDVSDIILADKYCDLKIRAGVI